MAVFRNPTLGEVRDVLRGREPEAPREIIPGIERIDAGVLVALSFGTEAAVTLTVRSASMRDHAGEVCFPGGKPDPNDRDLVHTALREASEEIGLDPASAEILGRLTAIPTATSRYRLNPIVAALKEPRAEWGLSAEVARVIDVPFRAFFDGTVGVCSVPFTWRGAQTESPFFDLDAQTVVYGATAFVLVELFAVLEPVMGCRLPPPRVVRDPPWAAPLLARARGLL